MIGATASVFFGWAFLAFAAIIVALKNGGPYAKYWVAALAISVLLGIAPFVSIAYFFVLYVNHRIKVASKSSVAHNVTYHPDGSYTVYGANQVQTRTTAQIVIRVIGGLAATALIIIGLFWVGLFVLVSLSCRGASKCM